MIVVLVEYRYSPAADDAMRSLVSLVEQFSRGFDGCDSFALSFPVGRPGILFGTEVWKDAASLNAHVDVAREAAELEAWHRLLVGMETALFSGERLTLEELRRSEV